MKIENIDLLKIATDGVSIFIEQASSFWEVALFWIFNE